MPKEQKKYGEEHEALAQLLSKCSSVTQYDSAEHSEAATLAHALKDIQESCRVLLETLTPKLDLKTLDPDQINDILLDIGEELRHILYHVRDPYFFRYLT